MSKSDFIYKEYLPLNARIIVDYSKNDKVRFSYPTKFTYWEAIWKRGYAIALMFWISIHIGLILCLFPFLLIFGIGYLIFIAFNPIIRVVPAHIDKFNFMNGVLPIVIYLVYFFGIPALITLWLGIDKERASKWFPKLGHLAYLCLGMTKEKVFTKIDVYENKIVIPSFQNIFLSYKCSKDFKTYLQKVEILEIPFFIKTHRFCLPFLFKKEKNTYFFRAVFYFSQTPTKGRLYTEFI